MQDTPRDPLASWRTFPHLSCLTLQSSQVLNSGLNDAESRREGGGREAGRERGRESRDLLVWHLPYYQELAAIESAVPSLLHYLGAFLQQLHLLTRKRRVSLERGMLGLCVGASVSCAMKEW